MLFLTDYVIATFAENPDFAAYVFVLTIILILISISATQANRRKNSTIERTVPADLEKPIPCEGSAFKTPETRTPGIWIPVDFKPPPAAPYLGWDVHKTEPLPYRPFKYGPYHITMGLRTMKWDEWIELDNQYLEWHAIKKKRIKERGEKGCKTAPEAYDGAIELLEEL